jgi:Semialdehyde dehydrogenase, dimerisation domain
VTGLVITLKPLADAFGLGSAIVTSMNGLSGAGRSAGVMGLDILDNVIPFIPKEEEKVQLECRKILPEHPAEISATCTRVNVLEGHTESVFASLARRASVADVKHVLASARNEARELGLPTAPAEWIKVHDDPYRPQPRLDRDHGQGMTTTVGRIREDNVLPNGVKYMLVSHNTRMGAAAGARCRWPSTWWSTATSAHERRLFRRGLEPRGDPLHRLGRGDDRDHLHVGDVAPAGDPLVEEATILTLHELVAAAHVHRDPARDVREALGRLPSFVPEPPVHRDGIAVPEALDDHVEHRGPLSSRWLRPAWWRRAARQRTRPARRGRNNVSSGKRIRIKRPTNSEIR